jgi:hypothetical protein
MSVAEQPFPFLFSDVFRRNVRGNDGYQIFTRSSGAIELVAWFEVERL